MVLAFFGEAVPACQIAVMGNVKTERLDNGLSLFYHIYEIFINIPGKQTPLFCQLNYSVQNLGKLVPRVGLPQSFLKKICRFL